MSKFYTAVSLAIVAALLVLSVGSVEAGKGKKPRKSADQRFAKADANRDGKLSLDEFVGKRTADKKSKAEKRFKKLDKNGDNSLSLEEFKAGQKKA